MNKIKRRVEGYTAGLEALCFMIKNGETESPRFRYGLEYYGLNEDSLWEIYLAWVDRKVHPKAREIMRILFKDEV